ncbi:organic cation transporter protein-like isoform X3 [Mizuhopecten yessoensis]|uniref:organic cation transporter protein-like isoform X3 n=1 Tax=Mizuhopecten yessoensis TaxID=6573 RepID=UPI000B45DECE|nr:organic cation transporter protein-like isoform X3 [Mizuhopecten yessoensis]
MGDPQQTESLVPKTFPDFGVMQLDEVLEKIGQFGRYQKIIFVLICIPGISCGIVMTLAVILLGVPNHRCSIPGYENDTYSIQDSVHQDYVSRYIPPSTKDTSLIYDGCQLYSYNSSSTTFDNSSHPINASLVTCASWVYDDSEFYETFVSKHDLVCGSHYKVSTAKSIFFGGVLVGALVFGSLSDGIGRKKTIMVSMALLFASSLGLAWAPNYIAYVILRFLAGMAFSGTFITAYVIGVEIVGPTKRKYTGIINEIFFAFGECCLAGIGYLVRDWHHVEIIIAAPMVLYLTYWWFIPESPRWLINKGRFDEAEDILRKAAKFNKKELPEKILDREVRDKPKQEKIYKIFTSRILFIRTLIILYNWLGRRTLHCTSMLAGGIACLSTIFTVLYGGKDLQTLTTVLALIGKLGSSAGFAIIYIYSAELFPTVLRNAAIGIFSCGARVGSMVAPLIADSSQLIGGKMGQAVPLVIFGAASVLAGILTMFLPETLNTRLPETIEDARLFGTEEYKRKKKLDVRDVEITKF